MCLLDYLQHHLLSRAALLRATSIDDATLTVLQQQGAAPQPSYRLDLDIGCVSFFGKHSEQASQEYYATGCALWIASVHPFHIAPFKIFADRYRARLAALGEAGISSTIVKLNEGLAQHLKDEWNSFLDGTYGLCTRTGLPEDIAAKELAVAIIEQVLAHASGRSLDAQQRIHLARAVDLLDSASSPFAAHEVERSSRRRLVDQVRATYLS